jgi:hypothetical protein
MDIDDERLMAYVDGELPADEVAAIESRAGADAALADRIRRARAMRMRIAAAYAPVLDEAVPARLRGPLQPGPETMQSPADVPRAAASRGRWGQRRRVRQWAAMAASLLLGVLLARVAPMDPSPGQDVAFVDGAMRAGGALVRALDDGLAAAGAPGGVSIGVSFRALDGGYCRSFSIDGDRPRAGLACRDGEAPWRVTTLAEATATSGPGLRQATSSLPPAVLADIDARIEGEPLNAGQERAARAARWR